MGCNYIFGDIVMYNDAWECRGESNKWGSKLPLLQLGQETSWSWYRSSSSMRSRSFQLPQFSLCEQLVRQRVSADCYKSSSRCAWYVKRCWRSRKERACHVVHFNIRTDPTFNRSGTGGKHFLIKGCGFSWSWQVNSSKDLRCKQHRIQQAQTGRFEINLFL